MQFITALAAFAFTGFALAVPMEEGNVTAFDTNDNAHCNDGCAGECLDGFCHVQGKYDFPCGGATYCDGLDGKSCEAYGNRDTMCPGQSS